MNRLLTFFEFLVSQLVAIDQNSRCLTLDDFEVFWASHIPPARLYKKCTLNEKLYNFVYRVKAKFDPIRFLEESCRVEPFFWGRFGALNFCSGSHGWKFLSTLYFSAPETPHSHALLFLDVVYRGHGEYWRTSVLLQASTSFSHQKPTVENTTEFHLFCALTALCLIWVLSFPHSFGCAFSLIHPQYRSLES